MTPEPAQDVPVRLGGTATSVKVSGRAEDVARMHALVDAESTEADRIASEPGEEAAIELGLIAERCVLKAGYSPERVALAVCDQASDHLIEAARLSVS